MYSSFTLFTILSASSCVLAASKSDYASHAVDAVNVLNSKFYQGDTGLWQNQWWESGNTLTTIGDLTVLLPSVKDVTYYYYNNTYTKAANQQGAKAFTNDYYDDEGWWALGWIRAYDVTKDVRFLKAAQHIFDDMVPGYNATCGGHWWNKAGSGPANGKQFNNAIGNGLFMQVAACLANRVGADRRSFYFNWAQAEWSWLKNSGLINAQNLVNEGIDVATCKNNKGTVFTYAQGVIFGALAELSAANKDASLLKTAADLAKAGIQHLTVDGILNEPGTPKLDVGGAMFKGPFVRNLRRLHQAAPDQAYVDFLQKNADSMWSKARNADGTLQQAWQGSSNKDSNIGCQTSGLDLLVAAAAVSS